MISGVRVAAELVISDLKHLLTAKDLLQNTKYGFGGLVTEIACGLHNPRVTLGIPPKCPKKAPPPYAADFLFPKISIS